MRFEKQPALLHAIPFTSGEALVAIDRQLRTEPHARVHVDADTGALVLDAPATGRTLRLP